MAAVHLADAQHADVAGRYSTAPIVVAWDAGSNVSHPTALPAGQYRVCANALCYIRQGATNALTITTANAHPLVANTADVINVAGDSDDYVNVYSDAGGALWLSRR